MSSALTDAHGVAIDLPQPPTVNGNQRFFNWSGVAAIGAVLVSWGVMTNRIDTLHDEVARLRTANDARSLADVRIAETMATKADVQRVSDQVQRLAEELRSARGPR